MTSLWFQSALLPTGWADAVRVTLQHGVIAAVETGVAPASTDERQALGLPGLCNVHSHAFQRGMAGLTERRGGADGDDFWTWREGMYRFRGRRTPDDVEAIAAQAYAEMLEGGFTRVAEFHYVHHDAAGAAYADPAEMAGRIVNAAEGTGIGLTLLPVFYAHADFGGVPPTPGQRRFINSVDGFNGVLEASARHMRGDATLGVAFHSLRAASVEQIAEILQAGRPGPIHMHISEQMREVEACVAAHGARPVDWLLDNAQVDSRWCLIHATHLSASETERLAASEAVAGLCPVTEANLGDGVFPAARFLALGGRFGLGTDSNVMIDAGQELRALEYAQRLTLQARCVLADEQTASVGRRLFDAAVNGGAQALDQHAGIAVGSGGDIITLDIARPEFAHRGGDGLLDSWIFATRGSAIDTVWRRGVKVVSGGRHRQSDAIAARYQATLAKLASD